MKRTCSQCGDPIDLTAWPIISVIDDEPALFCHEACHDRWRHDRNDSRWPAAR